MITDNNADNLMQLFKVISPLKLITNLFCRVEFLKKVEKSDIYGAQCCTRMRVDELIR